MKWKKVGSERERTRQNRKETEAVHGNDWWMATSTTSRLPSLHFSSPSIQNNNDMEAVQCYGRKVFSYLVLIIY
jgi:hypothetical protein